MALFLITIKLFISIASVLKHSTIINQNSSSDIGLYWRISLQFYLEKIRSFLNELLSISHVSTTYEFMCYFDTLPTRVNVGLDVDLSLEEIDKVILDQFYQGIPFFSQYYNAFFQIQIFSRSQMNNWQQILRYTRHFISSYKISTMAMFMYATILIFNIIDKDWEPYTLYLSSILSILFLFFGYLYYRMIKRVDQNPFF